MAAELNVTKINKQPSVRDTVKQALRSAIISGEMAPGQVYSAPTLGAQFGVSATPIREAMLDLVREGIVVALPNRGFQVTEVSGKVLEEVTELRMMLEPPAVEKATPVIPAAEFAGLRSLADRIVAAAEAGDLVEYLSADSDFHLALLRHAGNARLLDLVTGLRSQTRLFGLAGLHKSGLLVHSAREHYDILAAVQERDAARARDLIRTHIEHVRTDWSGSSADPSAAAPAVT
ncbi:GntR family transcriptional regulator [Microbacterium gorillae]|uniref:GntR family transcriptional regulator n=1 Tax=Microbacterium gorillae TaxID=1231063 RepID=UPI00058D2352|nr:GntR family transcriptional regulator [Microbacterium gorillae]